MSIELIAVALETALAGMSPGLDTAFDNDKHTPPNASTPYQKATTLFAKPNNQEYGSTHQELGYMQVDLMYPTGVSRGDVDARAELLRTTFARGESFTSGGVTAIISETPEVMPGRKEGERYRVPVKIPFYANIT